MEMEDGVLKGRSLEGCSRIKVWVMEDVECKQFWPK